MKLKRSLMTLVLWSAIVGSAVAAPTIMTQADNNQTVLGAITHVQEVKTKALVLPMGPAGIQLVSVTGSICQSNATVNCGHNGNWTSGVVLTDAHLRLTFLDAGNNEVGALDLAVTDSLAGAVLTPFRHYVHMLDQKSLSVQEVPGAVKVALTGYFIVDNPSAGNANVTMGLTAESYTF